MAEFINTVDVLGDDAVADSIIHRSITEYNDNAISSIGVHAFHMCKSLSSVDCPSATTINTEAFGGCSALKRVNLASVVSVGEKAFTMCGALEYVDFGAVTSMADQALRSCKLTTLIIRTNSVCAIASNTLNFSGIVTGTGYVYVPRELVDSYKAASHWSNYASRFRALEDYTVDGTITGELDESKI